MQTDYKPRLVSDLAADPTGRTLADDLFGALRAFDGCVEVGIPPGVYRLSARPHYVGEYPAADASTMNPRNDSETGPTAVRLVSETAPTRGINGTELSRPRFVAPERYASVLFDIGVDHLVDGIDLSRRAYRTGPQIRLCVPRRATVRDVRLLRVVIRYLASRTLGEDSIGVVQQVMNCLSHESSTE